MVALESQIVMIYICKKVDAFLQINTVWNSEASRMLIRALSDYLEITTKKSADRMCNSNRVHLKSEYTFFIDFDVVFVRLNQMTRLLLFWVHILLFLLG